VILITGISIESVKNWLGGRKTMDANKGGLLIHHDVNEDEEKNKEIAVAATGLLLSALIVSAVPPLVLLIAYIFHLNIIP
jgi:hypothetical protein